MMTAHKIEDISNYFSELIEMSGTTDILLNSSDSVYLDQGEGLNKICPPFQFNNDQLKSWVISQLSEQGKSWDAKFPFADFQFKNQHRVHVCFPPIHPLGLLVSIRKIPDFKSSTFTPIQKKWESSNGFSVLKKAVLNKETLIICGATGSGKTTLTQTLLSLIPSEERIISLEDTPELTPNHPHFLRLISKQANSDGFGEVSLMNLLKQCLRMRPDRIILGECRGNEVVELLQLLNTGHQGTLATLHANSARDAIRRLNLLCSIASNGNICLPLINELIASGIQWIAHVKKEKNERIIAEICQVAGKEGDTILLRQVLKS